MSDEGMRIPREAEIMPNGVLMRQMQKEERKNLKEYAEDQLFTRALITRQLLAKDKNSCLYDNYMNNTMSSNAYEILTLNSKPPLEKNNSIYHIKGDKANTSTRYVNHDFYKSSKQSTDSVLDLKFAPNRTVRYQGPIAIRNVVTLKHQSVMLVQKVNSHSPEPGCSNPKIYRARNEEELRVPSDGLLTTKTLGMEFCVTTVRNNDERIGSAESVCSHDSINQEIHHFKPIKAMPRTPSRFSRDGRQVDAKLIRVLPVTERVTNHSPKPPVSGKRIIGCSWSAFRGKIQRNCGSKCTSYWKVPSSFSPSPTESESSKVQTIRKGQHSDSMALDNHKNYTQGVNRVINGTRVSKKLILEDETDHAPYHSRKSGTHHSSVGSSRTYKTIEKSLSTEDNSYLRVMPGPLTISPSNENGAAIENIAERIKRRKVVQSETIHSPARNNVTSRRRNKKVVRVNKAEASLPVKSKRKSVLKSKHLQVEFNNKADVIALQGVESINIKMTKVKRTSSKSKRKKGSLNSVGEEMEIERNQNLSPSIQEQGKMESILRQEKDDYELAQTLQAQFNELESVSCRTRGSKRAFESGEILRGMHKMRISDKLLVNNVNVSDSRTMKSRRRRRKN